VVDDRTPVAVERALNPLGHDELAEGDVSDDDYLDEPPEDFYDGALEIMR